MKLSAGNRFFITGFFLLLCIGLWLRLRNIEQRPMHGDEANQAYQFQMLWEDGDYKYEPLDYHGPTLYYMTLPWIKVFGVESFQQSEKRHFRSLPLFFAMLTACCGLLLVDLLSRKGVLLLTGLQMISPSMIYYSTYYIQESLLVFGTVLFFASLWRFWQSDHKAWLVLAGASLGFMHATKETFVISLFAFALASAVTFYKQRFEIKKRLNAKNCLLIFFSGLIVSVLFYSSFLSNPQGPVDSVRSFTSHIGRGLGTKEFPGHMTSSVGHKKSFMYYVKNIVGHYPRKLSRTVKDIFNNNPARPITEILFLFLWVGSFFYMRQRHGRLGKVNTFFAVNTLVLLAVYSAIPYKTPWCAQVIVYSMIISGAIFLVRFLARGSRYVRLGCMALTLLFSADLVRQGMLITEQGFSVSDRNQYAYSHAVVDVEELALRIEAIAAESTDSYNMPIHFFTGEYWPLPWYLRRFNKIGYWEDQAATLPLTELPLVITTPDREDITSVLSESHQSELRSRLPGYWLQVFYRNDLWEKFMNSKELKEGAQQ